MARTPKPVRRLLKRARRETANYFGVKFNPKIKINRQGIDTALTNLKSGKPRTFLKLSFVPGETMLDGSPQATLKKAAMHEMFHGAHDEILFRGARLAQPIVSEAFAMLANMEYELIHTRERPSQAVARIREYLAVTPLSVSHREGLRIASNILQKYPNKALRRRYVLKLIKRNIAEMRKIKNDEYLTITALGEIKKIEEEKK